MKENSIEDRIEEKYTRYLNCETDTLELTIEEAIFILKTDESLHYVEDLLQEAYKVILSDYKRVLKENEIYKKNSEIMSKENLSTAEQLKVEIKENFRLKNQLENNRKEYQETYKDVREELKELKKENEELKAENEYNKLLLDTNKNFTIDKKNGNYKWNVIEIQKVKDKIEKYKNMCISNVKGYENYFKDNYNELVFRRMEQLEKELLESEE